MNDERRQDQGRRSRRGAWEFDWQTNVYRDVWLFLITLLVFVAMLTAYKQNSDRIKDIQASRYEVCQRANVRHDVALRVTNRLIARPVTPRRHLTPAQKAASERAIREWVDALVPKQDCKRLLTPPAIPTRR